VKEVVGRGVEEVVDRRAVEEDEEGEVEEHRWILEE
jgi:hypothetical protein